MHIKVREPGDRDRLKGCIGPERDAEQRDRYRAALLAIDGQPTKAVMTMLSRSRGFVQRWAYAYRDGGIDAIMVQPCGGSEPKLDAPMQAKFITLFKAGPTDADGGNSTLRGKDAVRILAEEFGVTYSLNGVYQLLHRHGLACLKPRPRHRKNDPQAMQQWLDRAPLLSDVCRLSTPTRRSKSGCRTKPDSANKAR